MSDTVTKPDTAYIVFDDATSEGGSAGFRWFFDRDDAEREYASDVREQIAGKNGQPTVVRLYSFDVSRIDFVVGLDEVSKVNDEVQDIVDNDFLDEDQDMERLRTFVPEDADWSIVWPLLTRGEIGTDLGAALGPVDAAGYVQPSNDMDFEDVVTHDEDWTLLSCLSGNVPTGSTSVEARDASFELLDREGDKIMVRCTAHVSGIWSGWPEGLTREQILGF